MSEQIFKYVPHLPDLNKKKDNTRKPYYVDKEVLNLTNGLFPLKVIDPALQFKKGADAGPVDHWVRIPINQQNKQLGPIYSWVKEADKNKLFIGEKFNVPVDIVEFSREEYLEAVPNPLWKYEEVSYLFDLLKTYNLNFVVANDRYNYIGVERTVEEIKQVYFDVSAKIMQRRNVTDHPLVSYKYDRKYEENRKFELSKYLLRNKENNDDEKNIIEELRKLEVVIKKEEREQIRFKKELKLDEVVEDQGDTDFAELIDKGDKSIDFVYTRQQYLMKPLPLPPGLSNKLNDVLQGLGIPERIIANEANQKLYDELRKKILYMFSAQRYIKKKQLEKKTLEERRRQLNKDDPEVDKKKVPEAVPAQKKKAPAQK